MLYTFFSDMDFICLRKLYLEGNTYYIDHQKKDTYVTEKILQY